VLLFLAAGAVNTRISSQQALRVPRLVVGVLFLEREAQGSPFIPARCLFDPVLFPYFGSA
jgi:hypothetical protein